MDKEIMFNKRQQWFNLMYGIYKEVYKKEFCLKWLDIHLDTIVKYSYYALQPITKMDKIQYAPIDYLRVFYFMRELFGENQNLGYNPFKGYDKKLRSDLHGRETSFYNIK